MINRSLPTFIYDESTGEITGYTTTIGGADSVFPFSSSFENFEQIFIENTHTGLNRTYSITHDGLLSISIGMGETQSNVVTVTKNEQAQTVHYAKGVNGRACFASVFNVNEGDTITINVSSLSTHYGIGVLGILCY